jgi:polyphosphate kinase
VMVRDPDTSLSHFARVKVPNNVPRFVAVGPTDRTATFLPLEDLIAAHLPQLFPGLDVVTHHLFRVTRNADVEVEEDRDEDLLQALERELARRRFGSAVRLEVTESMDPQILEVLLSEMELLPEDVLHVPGLLDLAALMGLYDLDRPELKDDPFVPATHPRLSDGETPKSVFATLREGDVLVQHPYYSFATSVQRFIEQAAADPQVLAIKQTLYRTSGDSPIVTALIEAAEAGKQVVVLVEIKARFDEEANITWARSLERAGCHVVYGLVGLKTHCKTALVVRREHGVLRRYCHIGTGNYNPKTARIYEDLGILTADPRVGADLTDLFNTLTGYSRQTNYRMLMVAPHGIRTGLVEKIRREARHAAEGKPAGIRFKLNSLVDERIIDALYEASIAGVPIELLIRGICSLRPGVPGLSETIRVRSIVGRFLEHSRVMSFDNDGEPEWWLGSADLMHRNLDRRVEVLLRVCDESASREMAGMFDKAMAPDVKSWQLGADGAWLCTGDRDYQAERLAEVGENAG